MDNHNYTIEHRKGQHLTSEERHDIEVHLRDGWSIYRISKHLRRAYNTIRNEVKRGTVFLYTGDVKRYKAKAGEDVYKMNRSNCNRKCSRLKVDPFIQYVIKTFKEKKWSLDSCYGYALRNNLFERSAMVCTKTLYNYVDMGLMSIRNIDLPEKIRRKLRKPVLRRNKKLLGDSIEEREPQINDRTEFGHWEIDSVIGKKSADEATIMTIVERKTRYSIMMKLANHTADAMMKALSWLREEYNEFFSTVFKSITADNGSEFSKLALLKEENVKVYFAHPYSSWERGTNERHNRLLRRFIKKGESISDYTPEEIMFIADYINELPRKILGHRTPEAMFDEELDKIYATP